MDSVLYILDKIGRYGRQILFFLSVFILYKSEKSVALAFYIFGVSISILINIILKIIIKEPRPLEDTPDFNFLVQSNKRVSYDKFGMPSGHTQFAFFTLAFMSYALWSHKHYVSIMSFYALITVTIVSQRIIGRNHTITQVIAGAFAGTLIGLGFVHLAKSKIIGKIRQKEDDNAVFIA